MMEWNPYPQMQNQSSAGGWNSYLPDFYKSTKAKQSQTLGSAGSDSSVAGNIQSLGQKIEGANTNGMGGFNEFMTGVKVGYKGATDTIAPFLAWRSARQQKQILGLQMDLVNLQKKAYETAADDAMRAGQQQSAAMGFEQQQRKASTRVSMAANGIQVGGAGSSAEVLTSQEIAYEMNVNQVMANAVATSFGYRTQAVNSKNQALALQYQQKSISPWVAAITTGIGTALERMNDGTITDLQGLFGGGGSKPSASNFGPVSA